MTELLGISSESLALRYCSGLRPSFADAGIKHEVHQLIHDLVVHIHKNEPDMEKSILIFLPTYQSLEQQWFSLKRFTKAFTIHILHSSIDTEQALMAMKIWKSHRKVDLDYLLSLWPLMGVVCLHVSLMLMNFFSMDW